MILVFLALLIGLGVMFGMQALVVDLGFDFGQQGAMQNAADAAALAAARLLANSVASSNPVAFAVTDNQVQAAANEFAAANRVAPYPNSTYQTALEYLVWNGSTCVSRNADGTYYVRGTYTASSDPDLVSELGGTRNTAPANTIGSVPTNTCGVRVFARMTHAALFARVTSAAGTGREVERVTAMATARIFPTNPPTTFTNLWPLTRWLGAPGCTFALNSPPCTFWDSRGPPNGDFKLLLDMSRYSPFVYQRQRTFQPQRIVDWDHTYPGTPVDNLEDWLRNGWKGRLDVADAARCSVNSTAILQFANCTNSRVEVYNGAHTGDVLPPIRDYIRTHFEGTDPTLGRYVTMRVPLWRYGESGIDVSTYVASTLWTTGNSTSIQRVIIEKVLCFRFYESTVGRASARGYFVSCLNPEPPINGPPSTISNTIGLID